MRVCVVGCGVIGSILVRYFAPSHRVWVCDHNPEKRQALASLSAVKVADDLASCLPMADLVILAVKPQGFAKAAKEIAPHLTDKHTVMSVIAGLTIDDIQKQFPQSKILRTMPNTAMSVGHGVLALAENPAFSADERSEWSLALAGLGKVLWLPEAKMDALTALAGSGIAYMFLMMEAFAEVGIQLGFDSKTAVELAGQTMVGAHELVKQSGEHPASLKWKVCSPAGATIDGLQAIEAAGLRSAVYDAIAAAYDRVQELKQSIPDGD